MLDGDATADLQLNGLAPPTLLNTTLYFIGDAGLAAMLTITWCHGWLLICVLHYDGRGNFQF